MRSATFASARNSPNDESGSTASMRSVTAASTLSI